MSAATASTARAAGPQLTPRRSGALRLVPQSRARAARTPFVVVVVALLTTGLLGLLVLNTVLAQDAFRAHSLTSQGRVLAEREQVLQREVEALRTPRSLAARAAELGMVPAGPPAFLLLPEGRVLGAELPAVAPELPPVDADSSPDVAPEDVVTDADDDATPDVTSSDDDAEATSDDDDDTDTTSDEGDDE